jgi:hypothetical protein
VALGDGGVNPLAIADGIAAAQQEHDQPLVKVPLLADLLPLIEDRRDDAMHRAAERGVGQPTDGIIERDVPGDAEALRRRLPPQRIGRGGRHADPAARLRDTAAFAQHLDEIDLPLRRPAIMAHTRADKGESGRVGLGGGARAAGFE